MNKNGESKKKKISFELNSKLLTVVDSILTAATLVLSVSCITQFYQENTSGSLFVSLFLVLFLSRTILGLRNRRPLVRMIFHLGYALIYLVCAFLFLTMGISEESIVAVLTLCMLTYIANRILAIIKNHRIRNIIPNALIALGEIYITISSWYSAEEDIGTFLIIIPLPFIIWAFSHVLTISFSQIRFGTLNKILRKTYALEVLFGLLLLIVTFSFIFRVTEPGIVTYEDALWYCFAIVTTIGFGDITAVSRVGRALSVILGIYGIIVVALITSVIVNFYTEVKDEEDRKESEAKAGADAKADEQEQEKETDPETTEKDERHGPEENEKSKEDEKS